MHLMARAGIHPPEFAMMALINASAGVVAKS
jgi:hypothetical protein